VAEPAAQLFLVDAPLNAIEGFLFAVVGDEIAKKTIMREVKMLRMLKHTNIVLLKEAFKRYVSESN
jgi:serine/threonine protein kinase